jgi:hypothetical protein
MLIKNHMRDFKTLCYLILEIRYGLDSNNASTYLIDSIFDACVNIKEPLTIDDMKCCFNYVKIEKKTFQKITLDEFLEPIKDYTQKKQVARQIIIDLQIAQDKIALEKQKEIDFYNEARDLYKSSLEAREWLGDMFQAKVLARPFWDTLYLDERKQIQMIATEKVKEAQILAIDNPLIIVADKNFYLAQEVISHCVKQGKTFIQG